MAWHRSDSFALDPAAYHRNESLRDGTRQVFRALAGFNRQAHLLRRNHGSEEGELGNHQHG
jgi:hypothetical protein